MEQMVAGACKVGLGTVRVIDQVKAYGPGHLVTADDLRALPDVLEADGASKGFLTTTSDFAPRLPEDRLLNKYLGSQSELVNGAQLLKRLTDLAKGQTTSVLDWRCCPSHGGVTAYSTA